LIKHFTERALNTSTVDRGTLVLQLSLTAH